MAKEQEQVQPLDTWLEMYRWLLEQPGHGVNTPQPRNLKMIIRALFRKEGFSRAIEIEREIQRAKPVAPAILRPEQVAEKKTPGLARLERQARRNQPEQLPTDQLAAAQARQQRNANRGLLETQTLPPVSVAKESVAADKKAAPADAMPLGVDEVKKIVADKMSGKQVAAMWGVDRVRATLEGFDDPSILLTGSATQLANRLIARITE